MSKSIRPSAFKRSLEADSNRLPSLQPTWPPTRVIPMLPRDRRAPRRATSQGIRSSKPPQSKSHSSNPLQDLVQLWWLPQRLPNQEPLKCRKAKGLALTGNRTLQLQRMQVEEQQQRQPRRQRLTQQLGMAKSLARASQRRGYSRPHGIKDLRLPWTWHHLLKSPPRWLLRLEETLWIFTSPLQIRPARIPLRLLWRQVRGVAASWGRKVLPSLLRRTNRARRWSLRNLQLQGVTNQQSSLASLTVKSKWLKLKTSSTAISIRNELNLL